MRHNNETSYLHVSLGRRAFTLIELLVVTTLVTLGLSVLIPALGRARDQTNVVACRANLRSLVLACVLYAGEHDGFLPTDANVDNPHIGLIEVLGSGSYVDTMEIYYCPSERRPELRRSEENIAAGNISYFYYSFSERPTSRYLSNFLRKTIQWPRMLKTTMPGDMWVASDSWFSNVPTAHRYYKKGVNYVTLSGEAGMVKESPRVIFR